MSVAKIIEISADSPDSFQDAVREGIRKANSTVKNIKSAWVSDQSVEVNDGQITSYRVHLKITFVLE